MNRALTILTILITLIGCAEKLEKEDLIGKFVHSERAETIVINSDGTYHHYLITASRQRLENSGNWKYDSHSNEVLFEDFSILIDNQPAGNWFSRIRTMDGETDLMYSSENNIYYRKQQADKSIQ